jgi:hypothetical protein
MPTFNDLKMFAMNRLAARPVGTNAFSVEFAVGGGRTQVIICRPFTTLNREWIEFRSAVAPANAIPPHVALQKNSELAVGALAIENDTYWVIYSMLTAGLDTDEFVLPLTLLATLADRIEQQYSLGDKY